MNITAQAVYCRLQQGEQLILLDVREPWEYDQYHIEGSLLIPLGELAQRLTELPRDRVIVAICHMGSRSGMAAAWLRHSGYDEVLNMVGGMDAWQREGLPLQPGP
ncbi:MAG: hypothetical protein KatS3mg057_1616 [Herpetosiphonaceae bacterium]|nr:MAG: hypothetical protein KatS3mg057_1616 [Herpetosiphonaceae bacterium]